MQLSTVNTSTSRKYQFTSTPVQSLHLSIPVVVLIGSKLIYLFLSELTKSKFLDIWPCPLSSIGILKDHRLSHLSS